MSTGVKMITNWYSTNIDLNHLSQRLRIAYALWIAESSPGNLPSLKQIQYSAHYEELSPYIAMIENQGDVKLPQFVILAAGSKVIELFGTELAARKIDDVFTETGRSLVEDVFDDLRNERKPVHCRVSGSPIISKDIEVMVMPLRHNNAAKELALAVYDF